MGHYCRICGRERPNRQFSGKGHKIHVCKSSDNGAPRDLFKRRRRNIGDMSRAYIGRMAKYGPVEVSSNENFEHLGKMARYAETSIGYAATRSVRLPASRAAGWS
jgi:hypothetical protein